jgi:hypothetical protein
MQKVKTSLDPTNNFTFFMERTMLLIIFQPLRKNSKKDYSHSIVAGGLELISYVTLFIPLT